MAELTNGKKLPIYSGTFTLIFSGLFAIFGFVKTQRLFPAYSHLIPSGIAFAVGIYNPPYFTLPRVLGAMVAHFYIHPIESVNFNFVPTLVPQNKPARFYKVLVIVCASGLVLGEGIVAVLVLILKALF